MDATIAKSPVNFHISLNVSNLGRSVDFYQKLFGSPPSKQRADYAKFESHNPPLTLSLEPAGATGGGALNHVGFRLSNSEELVELQRRLEIAGLPSQREEGVECCYARQTKFWLHDPDKTLWEFYVMEGDIDHRGAGQAAETVLANEHPPRKSPAAASQSPQSSPPVAPSADWEHRLGSPFPNPLPFADHSLAEVRLRGTFNVPVDGTTREAMFAEVARVLAPGGRIVLHQLTADRPFADGVPTLPGPAAVVKEVPVDRELLGWVEDGGFRQIRLVKFGGSPCFSMAGVEMRETIVEARGPVEDGAGAADGVLVVYKGPSRDLVDDEGRIFRRGERVRIPQNAWEAIRSGPLEEFFVCLKEQPVLRAI